MSTSSDVVPGSFAMAVDACIAMHSAAYRAGAMDERAKIRISLLSAIDDLVDAGDERSALWLRTFVEALTGAEVTEDVAE